MRDGDVLTISGIEDICEAKGITLVMHPAVRRAVKRFEESFYVGACCFLRDETEGLYYLPLPSGSYVRLTFTKRTSANGHPILRVAPLSPDGLARIKTALARGEL